MRRVALAFLSLIIPMLSSAESRLVEGLTSSPVRVVVYEDLQCSDCAVFRAMMDDHLLKRFGSQAAFEHRDFPLTKHAWARGAAIAARYFGAIDPALGVAFRRTTFAKQKEITDVAKLPAHVAAFAKANGKDPNAAVAALTAEGSAHAAAVDEDYREGVARGIAKTPTVFVNGEPFVETFSLEAIAKSIAAAIAAEGKR